MAEAIGARVLVDEVYAEAQYDEAPMPRPAATLGDVFVSTSSLTKAYGLAGLRCGWIIASPAVSARVRAMRDVIDGSGPYVAERLSLTAFEHIDRLRSRARQILADESRPSCARWLSPIRDSNGSNPPPAPPPSRESRTSTTRAISSIG